MDWPYLLTSFDGRIAGISLWVAVLAVELRSLFGLAVAYRIEGERLAAIVDLAVAYPEFAIAAKRGHDRDVPTWVPGLFFALAVFIDLLVVLGLRVTDDRTAAFYIFVLPISIFGVALLADFGFRKGTRGPNRYGPDPLGVKPRQ